MSGIIGYFSGMKRAKQAKKTARKTSAQILALANNEAAAIDQETSSAIAALRFGLGNETAGLRGESRDLTRNAKLALTGATIDELRQRRAGNQFMAEQKQAVVASGFGGAGFGDLLRDSKQQVDLDTMLVRRQGRITALDLLAQAQGKLAEAADAREAAQLQVSSIRKSASTRKRTVLLTGRTNAYTARAGGYATAVKAKTGAYTAVIDNATKALGAL